MINLSTIQAKPGEQVTVTGTGFRLANQVDVRFNALDGPVIASLPKPDNQTINTTFTVPPGTVPGSYVVIVTQTKPDGSLALSPSGPPSPWSAPAASDPSWGRTRAPTPPTAFPP